MVMQVVAEVKDASVKAMLVDLAKYRTQHLPAANRRIAMIILARTSKSFHTSTAPDGTPWAPLHPMGRKGMPLMDTRFMSRSFRPQSGMDWSGAYTPHKYAPVHHYGATIKPKNGPWLIFKGGGDSWAKVKSVTIPPRPQVGIASSDWPLIGKELIRPFDEAEARP